MVELGEGVATVAVRGLQGQEECWIADSRASVHMMSIHPTNCRDSPLGITPHIDTHHAQIQQTVSCGQCVHMAPSAEPKHDVYVKCDTKRAMMASGEGEA